MLSILTVVASQACSSCYCGVLVLHIRGVLVRISELRPSDRRLETSTLKDYARETKPWR